MYIVECNISGLDLYIILYYNEANEIKLIAINKLILVKQMVEITLTKHCSMNKSSSINYLFLDEKNMLSILSNRMYYYD